MNDGTKVQIPEIGKQTMSAERDERKGAGVGLLAKLGLGGGSGAGGAGGLAAGGGLLAGKAGVVALILAGSSVAAGIGMLAMGGGGSGSARPAASLFARAEGEAPPSDSAEGTGAAQAAALSGGASGSLDNFNAANKGAVVDPYAPAKVDDASNPAADQPADAPNSVPDHTAAPSAGTTAPAGPAPKMVKAAGFGSSGSSGGSGASGGGAVARAASGAGSKTNVAGTALAGSSALRGGGLRGAAGARRSAIMRGGGAAGQLAAHSKTLKGNLGSRNVSSAGSGAVMDGAGAAGAMGAGGGAISGGGAGAGGKGIDSSPGQNVSKSLREVSPPPEPIKKGKNKTSYQKEMMIAMGAMALGMIFLFVSSRFAADANPTTKAASTASAKQWAMAATAMGAIATGIGVWIMMQKGQMMQGAMIAAGGAILTASAAKAWIDASEAEKAQLAQDKLVADNKGAFDRMLGTEGKDGGLGYKQVDGVKGPGGEAILQKGESTIAYNQTNGHITHGKMVDGAFQPNLQAPGAKPLTIQEFAPAPKPAPAVGK